MQYTAESNTDRDVQPRIAKLTTRPGGLDLLELLL